MRLTEKQIEQLVAHAARPGEPMKKKTIRVRIAVLVDDEGTWFAFGEADDDAGLATSIFEQATYNDIGDDARLSFVEADVPMPDAPTIKGKVKVKP